MKFNIPEITIHSEDKAQEPTLYFTFRTTFTADASLKSTNVWAQEMEEHPEKQYHFIWDCMEMEGFEFSARNKWLETMKKYKSQILHVTVVSGNIMIRAAARVLLGILGLKFDILKSRDAMNLLEK